MWISELAAIKTLHEIQRLTRLNPDEVRLLRGTNWVFKYSSGLT